MEENDINNNLIIKTLRKRRLSTEPKFYVYSYTDPTNNIVRYIGKGTRPRVFNIANHNNVVRAWNKNLRKINLKPIITFLHENLIEQEALDLETKYIKEYGNVFNHTGTLFNFKSIGTGSSGGFRQKRTSTLDTKEKCRIASRKNRRKSPGVSKNDLISLNNYKEHLEYIVLEKEHKINILLNEIQELKQNNISEKFLEEMEIIRKEYVDYLQFLPPQVIECQYNAKS